MSEKLAWLNPVPLREAWANEASDFTPWLYEEENLQALADELGFEKLEPVGTEESVGPFSADILAEDMLGNAVLIENQLEQSDHDHLGKCLTYAAGLGAKTIIWICSKVREEHLAAVELLNEISGDEFSLFAVELELYRIGDSPLAPRFNVVSQPNNWTRQLRRQKKEASGELTEKQKAYRAYWSNLIGMAQDVYPALARRVPGKGNWQTAESITVGEGLSMAIAAANSRDGLRAEIYIGGEPAKRALVFVKQLVAQENLLSEEQLVWDELTMKRDSRVAIYYPGEPSDDPDLQEPEQKWLVERMAMLAGLLPEVVAGLRASPEVLMLPQKEDGYTPSG